MIKNERIRCKAIVIKIKNGDFGDWETNKNEILNVVKEEYNLTKEMTNYIVALMDGENGGKK